MLWDRTSHEGDVRGSAMPRRRGSNSEICRASRLANKKITGPPSHCHGKQLSRVNHNNAPNPCYIGLPNNIRLASLQVMYSLGIQKSIVASSRGSLFTWLETVGVILATHKV